MQKTTPPFPTFPGTPLRRDVAQVGCPGLAASSCCLLPNPVIPQLGFSPELGDRQVCACRQQSLEKRGQPGTGGQSYSRGSYISLAIIFLTQGSAGKHQSSRAGCVPSCRPVGHLPGAGMHPRETHVPKAQRGSHLAEILKPL